VTDTPLIRAANLWVRTSKDGSSKYLAGRMVGVRVLIFPNDRRESADDPSHVLMFGSAPEKPRTPLAARQAPAEEAHRVARSLSHPGRPPRAPRVGTDDGAPFDDPLP
jgi:hypothetical protein